MHIPQAATLEEGQQINPLAAGRLALHQARANGPSMC